MQKIEQKHNNTQTYATLVQQYGVLVTYQQLAEIFRRSPDGLRITLVHPKDEFARTVNAAKVRFGRRVLFRTEEIARMIDEGQTV